MRLPEEDLTLDYDLFKSKIEQLLAKVKRMAGRGEIGVSPYLNGSVEEIIAHGLKNVGMYHAKRPLVQNKEGNITTDDLNLLYYYHNRLVGYNLEKYVS